jgi:hypothetical protein
MKKSTEPNLEQTRLVLQRVLKRLKQSAAGIPDSVIRERKTQRLEIAEALLRSAIDSPRIEDAFLFGVSTFYELTSLERVWLGLQAIESP